MSTEQVPSQETYTNAQLELAGSLQAVLNSIHERDFSLDLQQKEALEAIGQAIVEGVPAGYVEMATSTGKTTVEALVAEAGVKAGKRVLLLAPTVAIAKQLIGDDETQPKGLSRFAKLPANTQTCGHFGNQRGNRMADIVVSTYAGFLNDVKNDNKALGEFDVIIADECHRSLGDQTSYALQTAMPHAFKLGLSATPDYALDRKSKEVYDTSLYQFSLLDAIESGKTAPVRALVYATDESVALTDPKKEFTGRELEPLVHNAQRNGTAIALALAFVEEGRRGIIACIPGHNNVHARLMADILRSNGIDAQDVGAHLPADEQARRLKLYQAGVYDILTFTRSIEEGWDSTQASFAINLAPTTSPVRTKQLLGRILRKKPDDLESVYIDFIDTTNGINKLQYTAMHALELDEIKLDRVLGGASRTEDTSTSSRPLKMLHHLPPELQARLRRLQGKYLRDVTVRAKIVDPLALEWESKLAGEGMPSELYPNDVLPPRLAKRALAAYRKFYDNNDDTPSMEELIEAMGKLSTPERKALATYGIRAILDDLDHFDLQDLASNDQLSSPYEMVLEQHLALKLEKVLETLSARESDVISMRFGLGDTEPKTYDEIGKIFGVTRERIRQIESKAIKKLRHPSRTKDLRDYLYESSVSQIDRAVDQDKFTYPFQEEFKEFHMLTPLAPIALKPVIRTEFDPIWYPDESGRLPQYWESVIELRKRLGLKNFNSDSLESLREAISEASNQNEIAMERVKSRKLTSYDQRMNTLSVYVSRQLFLKALLEDLNTLEQFLSKHNLINR